MFELVAGLPEVDARRIVLITRGSCCQASAPSAKGMARAQPHTAMSSSVWLSLSIHGRLARCASRIFQCRQASKSQRFSAYGSGSGPAALDIYALPGERADASMARAVRVGWRPL